MIDSHHRFIDLLEECSCPNGAVGSRHLTDVLADVSKHPSLNIVAVLRNIYELAGEVKDNASMKQLNNLLRKILTLRIGMRLMVNEYLQNRRGARVGSPFGSRCCPYDLALAAARDSRSLCRESLGRTPGIKVTGDASATVTYIPAVLQYMLTEFFKNACRAVAEKHYEASHDEELPAIVCSIETEFDGLCITISDEGCGMPKEVLERMWDFFYTTNRTSAWKNGEDDRAFRRSQGVLSGYGVGLPLSRMYARYFGGDLVATSEPGQGTTVRLTINSSSSLYEVFP
jgi:signal transduction histidine kinase